MTFQEFDKSLSSSQPPSSFSPHLAALWYDGKGDWEKAHQVIQDIEDNSATWIHAYLHRKEGDISNADYWYRRTGKTRPSLSLDQEWKELVKAHINDHS